MNLVERSSHAAAPTARAVVSSASAANRAVKLVGSSAFTLLMLVCAVRAVAAREWVSASVAAGLAMFFAMMVRRWYRQLRAAVHQTRAALE